jgi:hypothetical protein
MVFQHLSNKYPGKVFSETFIKPLHISSDNKVHELIAVKVLHTSLLNITVVTFKVLQLGSYALMPVPSPPFKTILELVLFNGLQSCRHITPGVISVVKMPSFQYFLYLLEQKKVTGGLDPVTREGVPAQLFPYKLRFVLGIPYFPG